jgi:hypothetical protein
VTVLEHTSTAPRGADGALRASAEAERRLSGQTAARSGLNADTNIGAILRP